VLRTEDIDAGLVFFVYKPSSGASDYLAVAIRGGYLEVSYSHGAKGAKSHSSIWSRKALSDGAWHSVVIDKYVHTYCVSQWH
jgi:hypothetical protein